MEDHLSPRPQSLQLNPDSVAESGLTMAEHLRQLPENSEVQMTATLVEFRTCYAKGREEKKVQKLELDTPAGKVEAWIWPSGTKVNEDMVGQDLFIRGMVDCREEGAALVACEIRGIE